MSMMAHRSAPCSTRSRVRLLRSRVTGRTTKTASPALSPSAIPVLGSLYRRARARCRARRLRPAPTQRDQHLQLIAEHGRMGWQKVSGYNRRALVEATISRFKRVIGDGLCASTDRRQTTEMTVAIAVLNRMLELGRLKSVRIA